MALKFYNETELITFENKQKHDDFQFIFLLLLHYSMNVTLNRLLSPVYTLYGNTVNTYKQMTYNSNVSISFLAQCRIKIEIVSCVFKALPYCCFENIKLIFIT